MDLQEAGSVQEKLKEIKVPFQLADGGKTIMVPGHVKDETRLTLINDNLPTGGVVGLELFSQTNFGETDTDRKAKYQRALQGELTRTIKQMQEIQNVRVHIVMPAEALFQEQQENATASIMIELKPFKKLGEEQIKGMVRLVANAIQGLKPENVSIIDSNMNDLTENITPDKGPQAASKMTAAQLDLQKQVQKDLERSAQSMLDRVMPGKAVVRVSAQLDFDQVEINNENYGNNVVRSQQVTEKNSYSENTNPYGVPGTATNIPTYQQVTSQTGKSESSESGKTTNYEVSTNKERTVVAQGKIKQLSVAVLVNGENISPAQKNDLENAVTNAVGLVKERGDKVSVSAIPFNTDYYNQLKAEMDKEAQQRMYLIYGALGTLALIVLIFVAVQAARKKQEQLVTPEGVIATDVLTVEELFAPMEPEISQEDKERDKILHDVENLTRQNPGNVAQLLKSWLEEE
jgi:flagellar M-ring protein FliF